MPSRVLGRDSRELSSRPNSTINVLCGPVQLLPRAALGVRGGLKEVQVPSSSQTACV